jgi:hypothetical protein
MTKITTPKVQLYKIKKKSDNCKTDSKPKELFFIRLFNQKQ